MNSTILVIDDEEDIRKLISGILEDEGYSVLNAASSDQAFHVLENQTPDLVIQDIWLQGSDKDGIDILKAGQELYPDLPFLMISGHGTIETAVSAIKSGAYDFIEKPFKSDRLLLMINRAIENAALKKQNAELRQKASELNLNMADQLPDYVRNVLDKATKSNSRIMITGEIGAGKSIAAHYVHEKSTRSDKPFMSLSCSTVHSKNLEKELFGIHGSNQNEHSAPGLLQLVNGGTLLLDEVLSMPMETQGKLLNVLHDNAYYKIGSNQKIPVDARIIATSSEDIEKKIKEGYFREDLYYRLNVVPIHLPALKERKNDISSIIEQLSPLMFSDQAVTKLKGYHWPGNIKQLNNVLEWVLLMHEHKGTLVDIEHLPQEFRGSNSIINDNTFEKSPYEISDSILTMQLREARESFERHYLLSQVNKFDGNISKTAEFIGMERSALHRKLKSLDVFSDDKQNVA